MMKFYVKYVPMKVFVKENLKIIYVLYENLVDKVKVKKKTVKDKPKIRFC